MDANNQSFRLLDQVRIFMRHRQVFWDYRVHEQTLPKVNQLGGGILWTDIVIDHVGYQEPAARKGKLERNLRLLEMDYAEQPDDSFTLFNLGWTLMDLGKHVRALAHLENALKKCGGESSILRKLYHLIVVARKQAGRKDDALALCREGLGRYPDDAELLWEEALLLLERKDLAGAEGSLVRLVETRPGQYFGSVDDGMRGFRTRHFLAGMYREQQRVCEAEVQLRAALADRRGFVPAWLGLGELFLAQGRWGDLNWAARDVSDAGSQVHGELLRAQGHLARREFDAAKEVLDEPIGRDLTAVPPRMVLSHVLLQEGKDFAAAERVLRDILVLDPHNAQAHHNLALVEQRRERNGNGKLKIENWTTGRLGRRTYRALRAPF